MSKRLADTWKYILKSKNLYILLIPAIVFIFIFRYIPMYGVLIAFKDFRFSQGIIGSEWNNFEHFKILFNSPDFYRVLYNSLMISLMKLLVTFPVPIILALMLNEIKGKNYKKLTQTIIYFPHFISWVVIISLTMMFLSVQQDGMVNEIIERLGFEPIPFLRKKEWFIPIVLITSIWKEAGWGTIIYLASLTGIDLQLYDAAVVDGANRWQKIVHVTLPSISHTIIVLFVLAVGRFMENGFEQLFLLQNPLIIEVADVFETYVYRVGLTNGQFSYATAVGVFTSVVGLVLITTTNRLAKRLGDSSIF